MPNSASAKKRVRQNVKCRAISRWRAGSVREQVKSFLKAVHDHDVKAAETELNKTYAILDRVSCTSSMHKNAAARRKSRLTRKFNEMKAKAKAA